MMVKIRIDDSQEKIGNNIQKFREAANLSQSELARRIGMSPSSVSEWEAGCHSPRYNVMFRIAKVLGVTVADLLS